MKKLFVLVFAIALCLGVLCVGASADGITPSLPPGSGTEENPYQIGTAVELYWFAQTVNEGDYDAHAVLTDNITINSDVLDENGNLITGKTFTQWTPICGKEIRLYDYTEYTGTFDGRGYTISGLYYSGSVFDYIYAGLFGYVGSGGRVQNVNVADSYISNNEAYGDFGGVCGCNRGTITNCSFSGSVTCKDTHNFVGGVCGSNIGTIENSYNAGTVTSVGSDTYVGGVCGYNPNGGTIRNCYNTGAVNGENTGNGYFFAGGVCGSNDSNTLQSTITNCYNTGSVTVSGSGTNYVGGVCGNNDSFDPQSMITNCYNTGSVTVSGNGNIYAGGVCGYNSETITNCYWLSGKADGDVGSNNGTVTDVESKTADQFASGEVAWLLQSEQNDDVWGQDIGEDASPLLTAQNRVYRALFMNGSTEHAARYCNSGGTVSLPDAPDAPSGQAFDGWFDGDTEFTEATVISSDITLNARFSDILVSSIRLSSASLTLQVGSTHTLTATVEPEGAANREITWSSSDTSVATVGDNGLVTAVGVGTATITASAQDGSGVSAECTVTVTPLPTYTVTVNDSYAVQSGAGSYVEGASVTVSAGERAGYRFAGWTAEGVTLADAGAATVTFTMPAHGVTLTASWDYINVPDPTYKPIVDVPEGVEVTTDPARPEPGDTVTVTTDPAGSISVTDKDGNNVDVTRNPDGSWSFTQPEGAVTITFTPDSGLPFTDVADGAWYYDAVSYVYANSLMDGTSDTAFNPNANMTRAMVWAILARVDGETVTGANWVETARE